MTHLPFRNQYLGLRYVNRFFLNFDDYFRIRVFSHMQFFIICIPILIFDNVGFMCYFIIIIIS